MPGGDMIAMRLVMISILIALSALIVSNLLERRMAKKMGRI
jgi:molybdate transport system permease protein